MSQRSARAVRTATFLLIGVVSAPLLPSSAGATLPAGEAVQLHHLRQPVGGARPARLSSRRPATVPLTLRGFHIPGSYRAAIEAIAARMFGLSDGKVVPSGAPGTLGPVEGAAVRTVADVRVCGGGGCNFDLQQRGTASLSGSLAPEKDGSGLVLMSRKLD